MYVCLCVCMYECMYVCMYVLVVMAHFIISSEMQYGKNKAVVVAMSCTSEIR